MTSVSRSLLPSFPRLQSALQRQGIHVEHANGIFQLHNEHAQASVLLPDSLPLEEKAVKQLLAFASVRSPDSSHGVCKACATPDFHPGSIAPVGSIVATDAGFVIPAAIGTDINCGMRLLTTGFNLTQASLHKDALIRQLQRVLLENARDVPAHAQAFAALCDAGPAAFLDSLPDSGIWAVADRDRLQQELTACIGLHEFGGARRYAPEAWFNRTGIMRDPSLGTTGGGNHFVELQVVDTVFDRHLAYRAGLAKDDIVVMIHSGSRDVGFYVGQRWMDRARSEWPAGMKHPDTALYGLSGELAEEYLLAMGVAARYAWANRMVLAELVRQQLQAVLGAAGSKLIVDVPHNVILREHGMNIHRKGATPARDGDLALIPGSMGDASYLVHGLGNPDWLWSCSHGAGRRVRRQDVRRLRHDNTEASWQCVTLREERRIEEAPQAYKPIGPVIEAQEEAGLIRAAVRLRPWVTFKA
ncbi:RtcB family protein [Undibacterium sp. CY18W]|uniref:tRNA-splicing ligase RtcB n=1 Tax=Undibacterium hunanense TaxID=2762292 RepID=A0ABR6ZL68_9BURK|nr:RtcB family protein [Undibacterium hunanense]MBC3916651.1 RtcB family protein [Undibacterium hunanense]